MATKVCSCCKKELSIVEFFARSKTDSRLKSACKQCSRERAKRYWRSKPLPKEVQREKNLKRNFNLSIDDYNSKLKEQKFLCAICSLPKQEGAKEFAVDHDHLTGKIRGLLCRSCNTGLGLFKDSQNNLKSAINYLEKYNGNS